MKHSYLKYILGLLFFGSNGVVASFIDLNSYEIVFLRTLIGSLFLILVSFCKHKKLSFCENKKQLFCITISGIAMGISWILLYEAYTRIGISIASLLYYCGPMIVMILSPILFKEKLTWNKTIGFVVVLCGVCLINGKMIGENGDIFGILYGLISAVMYSFMVIFNKKAEITAGLENATFQLFVSFLSVSIFVGIKQGFVVQIPLSSILAVFILGLLNTGIGCYLYFSSIGNLPVQTIAICGYLEPLSAIFFSVLFLKEIMQPYQIIGAILIVGGAILGEYKKYNIECRAE